jgi:hypothetical protein
MLVVIVCCLNSTSGSSSYRHFPGFINSSKNLLEPVSDLRKSSFTLQADSNFALPYY